MLYNLGYILLLTPSEGGGNPLVSFGFMAAIFAIMYFFMIRPQQKKVKDQRSFLEQLQKGDKVVTNGGIHGKVAKVEENTLLLELDSNTRIKVEKSFISVDFSQMVNNKKAS